MFFHRIGLSIVFTPLVRFHVVPLNKDNGMEAFYGHNREPKLLKVNPIRRIFQQKNQPSFSTCHQAEITAQTATKTKVHHPTLARHTGRLAQIPMQDPMLVIHTHGIVPAHSATEIPQLRPDAPPPTKATLADTYPPPQSEEWQAAQLVLGEILVSALPHRFK